MVSVDIQIPEEFLDEEIRCNYTISKEMKQVWAIEMDMLRKVDEICQKYHLTYYADSGTLIGAIRHKGFIPWDDDIDLVMKRADYNKLLEVASKEFHDPFFFQTTYSDIEYIRGHAQLRRSDTTGAILSDVNRKFNRGIFIDIFPLDNIPDNKLMFKLHKIRISLLWRLLYEYYYDETMEHSWKGKIFGSISRLFYKIVDYKRLFHHYEKVCSKYNCQKTKCLSYISYSNGKEKHLWEEEWFSAFHRVPFEFMDIIVPDGYDERLRKEYGDYMIIKNIPTSHGGVILNTDIPYTELLQDRKGEVR